MSTRSRRYTGLLEALAALPLVTLTAWHMLVARAQVQPLDPQAVDAHQSRTPESVLPLPQDIQGDARLAPVALLGHLDTVFPEGTPVKVRREGTKLHAPGVGDDARAERAPVHHPGDGGHAAERARRFLAKHGDELAFQLVDHKDADTAAVFAAIRAGRVMRSPSRPGRPERPAPRPPAGREGRDPRLLRAEEQSDGRCMAVLSNGRRCPRG